MAKKVIKIIKLQIQAAKANPAPPVGPALGQHGLNIQDFCSQFNEKTRDIGDTVVPVIINVYEDRSFSFIMKKAPAAELIKKAVSLKKGSAAPHKEKVGVLPRAKLREIAEQKMPDMNTDNIEHAMKVIAGTARSMGVTIGE